ncbi:hypothetical protein [Nocardioides rubriscoriae]|uniref:hypothetical protein n=1 Tax=Nocardioides rubriscoriae TaxID=642762 RepID=UPI0011DF3C67|nr:hypothetical protein [Nocardioides rubriscoriae]
MTPNTDTTMRLRPATRRHTVLTLTLLLALTVSSCSAADPQVADPISDSSSPTAPPTSDPPSSSPTEHPKPESAQAFIRRYAKAEAAMENSGETELYLALADSCESCEKLTETVRRYYDAGGSIQWDGWDIVKIARHNGSQSEYAVTVDSPPTTYQERANGPRKRIDGGRVTYLVTLTESATGWLIDETAQLAS